MNIYVTGVCFAETQNDQAYGVGPGAWSFVASKEHVMSENTVVRCGGSFITDEIEMALMGVLEAMRWAKEKKINSKINIYLSNPKSKYLLGQIFIRGWECHPGLGGDVKRILKQILGLCSSVKPTFNLLNSFSDNPFKVLGVNMAKKMAEKYRDGETISYSESRVGDLVALRVPESSYTKAYKVYQKLAKSSVIMLKPVYSGGKKDIVALSKKKFDKSLFIKIIW